MCGNEFFDPIPMILFLFPSIPLVVYKNVHIPSRNNIIIPIPSHSPSSNWYSMFRTSYDNLE